MADDVRSDDLESLLFLGHLEETVRYRGHEFVIRTLRQREMIEVSHIVSGYEELARPRAYKTALVAAALESVDGEPLYEPLSDVARSQAVRRKFEKVAEWYPAVIDVLYERIQALEARSQSVADALGE